MTMDSRAGTISMPPGRCAPPPRRVIVEVTGRGSGGVPTLPALVETARSQRPGAQAELGWRGLGRHVRFGFLLRPAHSGYCLRLQPRLASSRARRRRWERCMKVTTGRYEELGTPSWAVL